MKIMAVKRAHPSNERLGYLQAVLFEDKQIWEIATKDNVPETAEAFIHTNFKDGIDKVFKENELIISEISELDYAGGNCTYGSVGQDCRAVHVDDDICTVFDFHEKIGNKESYRVSTQIKPTFFSYLVSYVNNEKNLIGPFQLLTSAYISEENRWDSVLGIVGENSRFYSSLKPYSVYAISMNLLPKDIWFEKNEGYQKGSKFVVGIAAFLRTTKFEQLKVISDETLVRLIDEFVPTTSKLGRKGKRDLRVQLEASKNLKGIAKEGLTDLFDRMEELDADLEKKIKDALEKSGFFRSGTGKIQSPTTIVNNPTDDKTIEQLEELKAERKGLNEENSILTKQIEKLTIQSDNQLEQLKMLSTNQLEQKVRELEKANLGLYKAVENHNEYKNFELEKQQIIKQIESLKDQENGLSDTVSRLKSELQLNTSQFRNKALDVLPFLEIMNNIKPQKKELANVGGGIDQKLFVPKDIPELLQEVARRISEQGYKINSPQKLLLTTALFFSNKFIGFFGSPGTGKTALAKCLTSAVTSPQLHSNFLKVGKGWSSHTDFIGYDNAFSGAFNYKDLYFQKFELENRELQSFHHILTFDEATLSSPELYLSDFLADTQLSLSKNTEKMNFSGHTLFIPKDLRFIFTFNVDETTEQLSERVIDRTPIIYLDANEDLDLRDDIKDLTFDPICKKTTDLLLQELKNNDYSTETESLFNKFDERMSSWTKILKDKPSIRKKNQIDTFLNLVAGVPDIEVETALDFAEFVFLLPKVRGFGVEYREFLDEVLPTIKSPAVRKRLSQIKIEGQRYNNFRHI